MKKNILLLSVTLVFSFSIYAQRVSTSHEQASSGIFKSGVVTVDSSAIIQMLEDVLFGGNVSISNIQVAGGVNSIGFFSIDTNILEMDCGIVLSTGNVNDIMQPNTQTGMGTDLSLPGDAELDLLIPGYTTYDAVKIEFDFTSQDTLMYGTEFVFASEEYPEFVNSMYNDVFGFFIEGPGFNGSENIALVPNTTTPIAINNVNDSINTVYYHQNDSMGQEIEFDGYTSKFILPIAIIPGEMYHFKIAIADAGDGIYDSGVFLKSLSFSIPLDTVFCSFDEEINPLNPAQIQFTTSGAKDSKYLWNFGDGTYSTDQNPVHTFKTAGKYNVNLHVVSTRTKAHAAKNIQVGILSSSINNESFNSLKVVPANSEGLFNVELDNNSNSIVNVYNTNGQLIKSIEQNSKIFQLDLSNFTRGIYIVNVECQNNKYQAKITW